MTRTRLIAGLLLLFAAVHPFAQVRADVAMRAAMEKETVDGDLKGAIEAYKKIVDGYRENRPVRAQALLRMAECYRKLGDAQADETYRRIIRDFADQTAEAAIARSKVALGAAASGGLTIRRLDTVQAVWPDDISPDGARVAFTDWKTGNLAIRDVAGDRVLPVTSHPLPEGGAFTEFGLSSVFSPDGGQVAYTWCVVASPACHVTLRVARVAGREAPVSRVIYKGDSWVRAYDWSPDARQLAVVNTETEVNEIALIRTADGSIRRMRPLAANDAPIRMSFSPDGRHIAFDALAAATEGVRGRRDVFILPVAGGPDKPIATTTGYRTLVGWSSDGQRLLFTSHNRGTVDLYATRVVDGAPQGTAELLKSDIGGITPLRIGRTGGLFYAIEMGGGMRIKQASVDFGKGVILEQPVALDAIAAGTNTAPQWSPDGKWLAYSHRRQISPQARTSIMVRAHDTGDTREILLELTRANELRWAADGQTLYAVGINARGKGDLYSIDVATGGSTLLASGDALRYLRLNPSAGTVRFLRTTSGRYRFIELDPRSKAEKEMFAFETAGIPASPQFSPDGTTVFYRRAAAGGSTEGPDVLVERELASGAERELLKGRIAFTLMSPDGQYLGVRRLDPAGKWVAVSIVPTAGQAVVRDLMRVENMSGANLAAWSPDSKSVLVNRLGSDPPHADETWWVPLSGTAPRKLSQFMANVHVHPDGRNVAFQTVNSQPSTSEIWVMEHFLARPAAAKDQPPQ